VRSVALAHNKAVENASGDFIVFIDDDEFPTPNWLCSLFQACCKYGADGVLGPVRPHFEQAAPKWLVNGGLFDRPSHPTGMPLAWRQTRAGNVLMKSDMFAGENAGFNPRFRAACDQDFFKRMINRGRVFIWCEEAPVFEVIPPARWKRSFVVRRALFRGVFSFHNQPAFGPVAQSLLATLLYSLALPFALILSHARFMRCVCSLSYHIGRILASLGIDPIKDAYISE
jgi:hypothetical protein